MSAGEMLSLITQIGYYAGWASLAFIPYWMCTYFSSEKKKEELERTLSLENDMTIETVLLPNKE